MYLSIQNKLIPDEPGDEDPMNWILKNSILSTGTGFPPPLSPTGYWIYFRLRQLLQLGLMAHIRPTRPGA